MTGRAGGRGPGGSVAPTTTLGRWAVALGVVHVLGMLSWSVLPGGGAFGLVAGAVAGALALVAILRRGERAAIVMIAVLPLALVVLFLAAELLLPH